MKPSILFKDFRIEYHGWIAHGFDPHSGLHVWKATDGRHDDIRENISRWNITQDSAPETEVQFAVRRRPTRVTAVERGDVIETDEEAKVYRETVGDHFVASEYRLNSGDISHFAKRETMERVLALLLFMTDVRVHSGSNNFWSPNALELHDGEPFDKMRFIVRVSRETVVKT